MLKFRELKANEIDVRVAQCGDGWAQLLLYKDARVDMAILDETLGTENWMREHYECKGNLFCKVGINVNFKNQDKEPRWIWKSDCGAESNTEKEKGESSDSFKRACVNFGIGRELYTKIPIFVNVSTKPNGRGGFMISDKKERFYVKSINIDKELDKILYIEIGNKAGQTVFKWSDNNYKPDNNEQRMEQRIEQRMEQQIEKKLEYVETATQQTQTQTDTTDIQPAKKTRVKRQ